MPEGSFFERFECGPGLKLAAHERVSQIQFDNINNRLDRLEELIQRLEKRLWLAVYGVVAMILSQAVQSVVATLP